MFENHDGRLEYRGNQAGWLWPGDYKPGLWMSAASRMGRMVKSPLACVRNRARMYGFQVKYLI